MQHVKLNSDQFVGDRTRRAGEVVPFPDKVAEMYVKGGHGVIVPEPTPIHQAVVPPAPRFKPLVARRLSGGSRAGPCPARDRARP